MSQSFLNGRVVVHEGDCIWPALWGGSRMTSISSQIEAIGRAVTSLHLRRKLMTPSELELEKNYLNDAMDMLRRCLWDGPPPESLTLDRGEPWA